MKSEAQKFVAFFKAEISKYDVASIGSIHNLGYLNKQDWIDEAEPWRWPWSHWDLDPDNDSTCIEHANREDLTAVFSDGSRATWTNRERAWSVCDE